MTRKRHFQKFESHTLVKHFLLDSYVKGWASILLGNASRPGKFRQIWFVDAFAGAGGDEHGHPGSPVIAAQIACDVNAARFPLGIGKRGGMRVLAFETDEEFIGLLTERMKGFTDCSPWIAKVRNYSLDTRIDHVVGHLKQDPALYFLDPFGVDGLSASVVKRIFEGDHNEVLALFCDEGAVRLAGKVRVGDVDAEAMADAAEAEVRAAGSLFGEEDVARQAAAARGKAGRAAAGHRSNPDAKRIMDLAFGGDWWQPIVDATPESERDEKAAELYERVLRERGADYVLKFEVKTDEGRRKYYLIHGSKKPRAHAAMKGAMHRTMRNQAANRKNIELLGEFAASTDVRAVAAEIARHFAGQRVRWTYENQSIPTVKAFAIDETPLWIHECEALKTALIQFAVMNPRGKPASPLTYVFPSASD
jgi:three-Cys-motif partner protein